MGQQPNIEIREVDKPRRSLEPPPAKSWRPDRPGVISSPDQVPAGGGFGHAGPDAGWGLRLLARTDLPDDDPRLRGVVEGLMMARAARLGRAPVPEDIEAALVLCGFGFDAPESVLERRNRWMAAVPHEQRPGAAAVADVDANLIVKKPEQIRYALNRDAGHR